MTLIEIQGFPQQTLLQCLLDFTLLVLAMLKVQEQLFMQTLPQARGGLRATPKDQIAKVGAWTSCLSSVRWWTTSAQTTLGTQAAQVFRIVSPCLFVFAYFRVPMQTKLSNSLSPLSKVWVYAANRVFNATESAEINELAKQFAGQWTAHKQQLSSDGGLLYNCFIVLMVDESMAGASGCSIDSSVRFVKEIGTKYQADFFNRMLLYYVDESNQMQILPFNEASTVFAQGTINDSTEVFNHLVNTKESFEATWKVSLAKSPLLKFVASSQPSFNLSLLSGGK